MLSLSATETKVYMDALELYRRAEYKKALSKLDKHNWHGKLPIRVLLLYAYIFRGTKNPPKEVKALGEIIERAPNVLNDEEKSFMAEVWSLLGEALSKTGEAEGARDAFLISAELEDRREKKLAECSNAIFAAINIEKTTPAEAAELFAKYRAMLGEIKSYSTYEENDGALRLGLLSADFRRHPVAPLIMPILRHAEKNGLEIYCYSAVRETEEDEVTLQIRSLAAKWRNVASLTAEQTAKLVHEDKVEVLFDLSGHTAGNLLPVLAYKPAPVQMSGIGYMGSTGLNELDYFLGDVYLDEAEESPWFTEKLLRLPHTHFCLELPHGLPACGNAPFLKNGFVTFGCFNNLAKLTDEMLFLWGKILSAVPNSRLKLKHILLGSAEGRDMIKNRLQNAGIDTERVELANFSADYYAAYSGIDIALDTYPYTGGMTTIDALMMGVPVISLYGERHGTRFGLSILSNCGLGELAVKTKEEYFARAVSLANDAELLVLLHQNLRGMVASSPLTDGEAYAHDFAKAVYHTAKKRGIRR